jgi:AraC-like DNA-binding protein
MIMERLTIFAAKIFKLKSMNKQWIQNIGFRLLMSMVVLSPGRLGAQTEGMLLYKSAAALLPDNTDGADSIGKKLLVLSMASGAESDSMVAKSYFLLAMVQYYKARYQLSSNYYNLALKTRFGHDNDRFAESCWNNLGVVMDKQMRTNEALDAYYKSLHIAEKYADSATIVQSWINIALLEANKNNYEKAISIDKRVLEYAVSKNDTLNMALCHQNMGNAYQNINEVKQSIFHSMEALRLFRIMNDPFRIAHQLVNVGSSESQIIDDAQKKALTMEAISIANKYGFDDALLAAYTSLGSNNIYNRSDLADAERYLKEALAYGKKIESDINTNVILLNLSVVYARMGDFAMYQKVMDEYLDLSEKRSKDEAIAAYAEMQVLYDLNAMISKNTALEEDIVYRRTQLWMLLIIIAIFSTAMVIIAYLYYRLRRYVKTLYKLNVEQVNSPVALPTAQTQDSSDKKDSQFYDLYKVIIEKIESQKMHLNNNISLQDVCDLVGSNRSYVSQAIKQYGDTNFAGLISRFRVNTARKLILAQGDELSLKDIADQSGFSNRVSFYRQFKDITGFSPTEFRDLGQNQPVRQESGTPEEWESELE